MRRLEPRAFLVTGAASGIGRDLVHLLVEETEARVWATDLRVGGWRDAGWPVDRVSTETLDVTDAGAWEASVAAAEDRLGPIDVLANVAGFLDPGWAHELDPAGAARTLDVNVKGVVFGTRVVAARMAVRGRGHVVNVASLAGLAPIEGLSVYSASKFAVRAFSLAAAQELGPRGVGVSVICPDATETPMLALQEDREEAALTFSGARPLRPREVSRAILGVIGSQRLEVFLPRGRGWLARLGDVFPSTLGTLGPLMRRRGRAHQARRRLR